MMGYPHGMETETPGSGERKPEHDLRVFFAAERTLLSWVRTAVALMGFGFIVARFGMFIRIARKTPAGSLPGSTHFWTGTNVTNGVPVPCPPGRDPAHVRTREPFAGALRVSDPP